MATFEFLYTIANREMNGNGSLPVGSGSFSVILLGDSAIHVTLSAKNHPLLTTLQDVCDQLHWKWRFTEWAIVAGPEDAMRHFDAIWHEPPVDRRVADVRISKMTLIDVTPPKVAELLTPKLHQYSDFPFSLEATGHFDEKTTLFVADMRLDIMLSLYAAALNSKLHDVFLWKPLLASETTVQGNLPRRCLTPWLSQHYPGLQFAGPSRYDLVKDDRIAENSWTFNDRNEVDASTSGSLNVTMRFCRTVSTAGQAMRTFERERHPLLPADKSDSDLPGIGDEAVGRAFRTVHDHPIGGAIKSRVRTCIFEVESATMPFNDLKRLAIEIARAAPGLPRVREDVRNENEKQSLFEIAASQRKRRLLDHYILSPVSEQNILKNHRPEAHRIIEKAYSMLEYGPDYFVAYPDDSPSPANYPPTSPQRNWALTVILLFDDRKNVEARLSRMMAETNPVTKLYAFCGLQALLPREERKDPETLLGADFLATRLTVGFPYSDYSLRNSQTVRQLLEEFYPAYERLLFSDYLPHWYELL